MTNTPDSIDVCTGGEYEATHASEIGDATAEQREAQAIVAPEGNRSRTWPYVAATVVFELLGFFIALQLLLFLAYGLATSSDPSDLWEVPIGFLFLFFGFPVLWLIGLIVSIALFIVGKPKAALWSSLSVILVGLLAFVLGVIQGLLASQ